VGSVRWWCSRCSRCWRRCFECYGVLCMLEATEGRLCSLEVVRCMLLRMLDAMGEWAQFQNFEISIVAAFSLQSTAEKSWRVPLNSIGAHLNSVSRLCSLDPSASSQFSLSCPIPFNCLDTLCFSRLCNHASLSEEYSVRTPPRCPFQRIRYRLESICPDKWQPSHHKGHQSYIPGLHRQTGNVSRL